MRSNAEALDLALGSTNLRLADVRYTLTGSYMEYDQTLNELPILTSKVSVSVDLKGSLNRVYRNTVMISDEKVDSIPKVPEISEQQA